MDVDLLEREFVRRIDGVCYFDASTYFCLEMVSLFESDYQYSHQHDAIDDRKDYVVENYCRYYSFDDDRCNVNYLTNRNIHMNDIDQDSCADQNNYSGCSRLTMD